MKVKQKQNNYIPTQNKQSEVNTITDAEQNYNKYNNIQAPFNYALILIIPYGAIIAIAYYIYTTKVINMFDYEILKIGVPILFGIILLSSMIYSIKKLYLAICTRAVKYGMTVDDVRTIMRHYKVKKVEGNINSRYLISYEIRMFREFERKIFIFENNHLVGKDKAYRRISYN